MKKIVIWNNEATVWVATKDCFVMAEYEKKVRETLSKNDYKL